MTLHKRHLQEWKKSKVSEPIIRRNVWSIDDSREVDELLNRNTKTRWKHSTDLVPGFAVAGVDPVTGERSFKGAQFKPDKSPIDPDTHKPRKYFSPSRQTLSPLFLGMEEGEYWQRILSNPTTPIVITEGAKKAGSLLSIGLAAISLPGVSTGGKLGRLRPELAQFCGYGRPVYLAFDRDIVAKPQVRKALHNLARMIAVNGAMVYVIEWANQYKGVDDAIANGVNLGQRLQQALTIAEWKEQCEAEQSDPIEGEKCSLARRVELLESILSDRLKWNNLKGCIELDGEVTDPDTLRIMLALRYNIGIPVEDCIQICTYIAKKQTFSPVVEYLEHCAQLYGPDEELLDGLAESYLGASSALHRAYLRKTLIAAVGRAVTPGCKVDTVCILAGGQDLGKSSFWKYLASEDWFDDTFGSASDKDERLKLHQSWFIEWAELESIFKRKDISTVKAFITTQADQLRPPYGRVVQEFKRPSIIVGTTNESEFLGDATGNRRYWIIPVTAPTIDLERLASDRDRIWAAAFHAFKAGEKWLLPQELREVAKADSQNYTFSDPWEETILDYCELHQKVTSLEILVNALKLDLEKLDKKAETRVTKVLAANGWKSCREYLNKRRQRVWHPPDDTPTETMGQPQTTNGTTLDQGVVPSEIAPSPENSTFVDLGCPSCPKEAENQAAVVGQPMGQPTGQPTGQPPHFDQKTFHPNDKPDLWDNWDNQDGQIPKSSRSQDFSLSQDSCPSTQLDVGDHVEILTGQFVGKRCQVEAVESGSVTVRAKGWYVSQIYPPDELRLLSNRKSRIEERDRALANGATLADAIKQYPDEV